jgi:hypothetical protein
MFESDLGFCINVPKSYVGAFIRVSGGTQYEYVQEYTK